MLRIERGARPRPRVFDDQKKPGLRSRPQVAQSSDATRPAQQNAASTFNVSVSIFVAAENREKAWTNAVVASSNTESRE